MRTEKGITLISLIITIIVMLILVAVTVTVVINSGILTSAQNAANKWDEAGTDESNIKANISGTETTDLETYVNDLMAD